jgi:hypothetical protein
MTSPEETTAPIQSLIGWRILLLRNQRAMLGGCAAEGIEAKRSKIEDRVVLPISSGWAPGRRRWNRRRPVCRALQPMFLLPRSLLDADLAELYGVQTKVLVQAVKRNLMRFPSDFMFQLSATEFSALRSQTVTSKPGRGGRRSAPYAFTEQGVAMLSSVLGCPRAIAVNIEIMRTFVRVRELAATHSELAKNSAISKNKPVCSPCSTTPSAATPATSSNKCLTPCANS